MTRPRAVRLIGVPADINSSFERGTAAAPPRIRAMLWSDHGNPACEDGAELGRDIRVDDVDVAISDVPEADDRVIEATVAAALAEARAPIVIGGDHSISFPVLRAVARHCGPPTILHFDAHPDLYDSFDGNRFSHASPFARIMEQGLARRLVQVGIRTMNAHCRAQAERFSVEVVPMRDFTPACVPAIDGPLYISIDLDGLDPAYAPGVAHPEPGGLSVRQLLDVLARQSAPVIGGDVVEYNPGRDVGGVTAVVAAKLVKELCALASRG